MTSQIQTKRSELNTIISYKMYAIRRMNAQSAFFSENSVLKDLGVRQFGGRTEAFRRNGHITAKDGLQVGMALVDRRGLDSRNGDSL